MGTQLHGQSILYVNLRKMLAARKSVAKVPGVFDNFYPHSPLPSPLPQYYNLSSQRHKCRYSVSIGTCSINIQFGKWYFYRFLNSRKYVTVFFIIFQTRQSILNSWHCEHKEKTRRFESEKWRGIFGKKILTKSSLTVSMISQKMMFGNICYNPISQC